MGKKPGARAGEKNIKYGRGGGVVVVKHTTGVRRGSEKEDKRFEVG